MAMKRVDVLQSICKVVSYDREELSVVCGSDINYEPVPSLTIMNNSEVDSLSRKLKRYELLRLAPEVPIS